MSSRDNIDAVMVPAALFSAAWQTCAPLVLKGMQAAAMDMKETADRLAAMDLQLWVVAKGPNVLAAFMTELLDGGDRRVVNICGLSGNDPKDWANITINRVEEFARSEGADAVRFAGKQGWQGYLPHYRIVERVNGDAAVFERAML